MAGVAALGLLCALAGCHPGSLQAPDQEGTTHQTPTSTQKTLVSLGDGNVAFPGDSLTDWVSYGDVAAIIRVTSETADQPDPTTDQNGEGLVGRKVTAERQQIVWQRKPTYALPATFQLDVWGWTVHDRQRIPTVTPGASRIEVGHDYLVVLTNAGLTLGWTSIGDHAVVPADGMLGTGERRGAVAGGNWDDDPEFAGYNAVTGKPLTDVATLLATTLPDPLAVKYEALPPAERWKKVAADRHR